MTRKIGILLVMLSLITLAIILVPSCVPTDGPPRPHRYKYFTPVAAIDLGVPDYVDLIAVGKAEGAIADLSATVNGHEATVANFTAALESNINRPIRPGDHIRLNVDDAFRADDRVHVEIVHVPTGYTLLNTIVRKVAPWAPPPLLREPAPPVARGYLAGFVTDAAGVPIRPIVSPIHPLRDHEVVEQVTVEAENLATGVGWFARTDESGILQSRGRCWCL